MRAIVMRDTGRPATARMVAVLVFSIAMALAFARPSEAESQVPPTSAMAEELEKAATGLHARPDRWADAARLYVVAASLRQHEDPAARRDLFLAANLYFELGDRSAAVEALESAGARARAAGDREAAERLLRHAAWVADARGRRARPNQSLEAERTRTFEDAAKNGARSE